MYRYQMQEAGLARVELFVYSRVQHMSVPTYLLPSGVCSSGKSKRSTRARAKRGVPTPRGCGVCVCVFVCARTLGTRRGRCRIQHRYQQQQQHQQRGSSAAKAAEPTTTCARLQIIPTAQAHDLAFDGNATQVHESPGIGAVCPSRAGLRTRLHSPVISNLDDQAPNVSATQGMIPTYLPKLGHQVLLAGIITKRDETEARSKRRADVGNPAHAATWANHPSICIFVASYTHPASG
ncbi:hypothetical protein F4780DRAFT_709286 [Xylariomycetidae sp. FL0641]|nr:hypothetical protein F4780DRAFT_709286 [Xylariomycetidae sp. FL0641]